MAETGAAGPPASVRVGLVGYGLGGSSFHAPFIDATPELDLVAVVTTDPGRRALVLQRHPLAEVVGSVEELLARADLDLVVVTTPNATHVPLALAVLRSGRHVVVDKPVAPTAEEARAVAWVAAEHGRVCIPFHNRRWDGDFRTVRDLVDRGRLGPLQRAEIRWERWRPQTVAAPGRAWKDDPAPGAAGGVHFDLGPHLVDQALLLLGRPATVYAELGTRRAGARAVDDAFLGLTFPGGAVAHLTMSLTVGGPLPRFHVVGRDATYVGVTTMDPQEAALAEGRLPGGPGWGSVDDSEWGALQAGNETVAVPTLPGDYGAFYRGVARTVLAGDSPPVTIGEAVTVLEVLDAARRSAEDGTVVRLPERPMARWNA
ncbi:Gfo/Idh/MocA family oxidoreductase [Ornithinimicrobium sp. LYQ103]|uniref:Gfo/Idh/MocA family protein n=1 Tax=Ornithinimicrobium sp. LYQ103 TaxID=3378796 RepID=UPI0038534756